MHTIQKDDLPLFVPHSLPNRIYPNCAHIVSDKAELFLELFNNKRIPIRSNHSSIEFPRQIEIVQSKEVEITCMISAKALSQAIGLSIKKVAILFKRGQINLTLDCMREFPNETEQDLDKRVQKKIAEHIKSQTNLISKKDFCSIHSQCHDSDNQKKWQEILNQAQTLTPGTKSITVVLKGVTNKHFRVEFRGLNNVHLRLKKNIRVGTANLLSLHVDMFSGLLIAKNKYAIGSVNNNDKRRGYTRSEFIEMAHVVSRLHHAPGVISHLKSPEFSPKGDKAYLFTEFFPEGDLFDKVLKDRIEGRDTFRLLKELCHALEQIHLRGCIHRDVKPENVFLKKIDNVWKMILGDLEFAELKQESSILVRGTLNYYPPELVKALGTKENKLKISPAVDIYALGMVAYFAIFKQSHLWNNFILNKQLDTTLDLMRSIAEQQLIKSADPRIRKVLLGLLNFESNDRMSLDDAAEIFEELYRNPPQ